MDIFGTILWPIKWVIELILVGFHSLWTAIGMEPTAGITWVLSIVGLVLIVRAALIPVFVKQIKSQRRMLEVAPQLKKIQDKYKGKRDQFSREAMSRETMEMYKKTGTNPLSSCLPLLLQMPIFFGLFSVLNDAQHDKAGVGMLSRDLADSFANSELFGAPLRATFLDNGGNGLVMVIAAVMVLLMTASQFITQLQIMAKNMSPEAKNSPMFRQQKVLLYILPLVFAVSGVAFPLGVMFYWLTSNFWTMGQQFLVIRNMPTPGSEAAKAREARLAKRGKLAPPESSSGDTIVIEEKKPVQRVQPVSKTRAKKQSGGKKR
jgi:YidC/Oxa1 family membrane protein insertase